MEESKETLSKGGVGGESLLAGHTFLRVWSDSSSDPMENFVGALMSEAK